MLEQINKILKDPGLEKWLKGDVCFVKILDIKDIGEHQCYDLTVPETSSFIANDIIAHNTTFALNWANHISNVEKHPYLFYCCEMKQKKLGQKVVGMYCKDFTKVEEITEIQIGETAYGNESDNMYFGYPDKQLPELDYVCEVIEQSVKRYGIKFVVFDNLH